MEGGEQEAGTGGGTDNQSSSELSEQLLVACEDGDLNKVKYLVEVGHVDPHSCRDEHHHDTPLHWASEYGNLDIVRYLVEERNCDVKCRNKYENTPLHLAAEEGRSYIVQYLISEKSDAEVVFLREGRETMRHHPVRDGLPQAKFTIRKRKIAVSIDENGIVQG